MRNPNFHTWDPTPISGVLLAAEQPRYPSGGVRRTAEQSRCRWVYPDGHVCGKGHGWVDHVASMLPDPGENP